MSCQIAGVRDDDLNSLLKKKDKGATSRFNHGCFGAEDFGKMSQMGPESGGKYRCHGVLAM